MAGTSPRRSIRSRPLTQQNSNSHHSSASSNSSSRGERNTRTSAKAESPRKLTSNESLSSEPLDDRVASSIEESLSTRRRKRGQTDEQDKELKDKRPDMPNGISEPVGEDDEAVRCICGSDDYPGPPQISDEDKKGIKEVVEPDLITPEDYTEDLAGFFLQCDMCKVWQHGGCVGIKNEDMSPDEYFCELCRSDLHKVFTASNGQKYSHYLPLYQHQHEHHQTTLSRSTSRASRAASFSKDGTRSPRAGSKNGRPTSSSMMSANQKRRSTMNSRDAAYDEEEQLRRAIEASKGEKSESTDGGGGGTSRKRGRSDSEEKQDFPKRQRTLSNSPSPQKEALTPFGPSNDSDDAETTRPVGAKKIRGAAARNHREKEAREEREKTRLEAANKRKGRAERRRVDDLEPPEDLLPSTPTPTAPSTTVPQPTTTDTPPAPPASIPPSSPPPPKTTPSTTTTNTTTNTTTTNTITTAAATTSTTTSHKKGGRPAHTRKGKVGKNQYTRDRDADDSHNTTNASPRRSESREGGVGGAGGRGGGEEGRRGGGAGGGGRGKTSILDMRRRVAGMLEFISRTQVEMAEMGDTGEAERVVRALGGVGGVDFGSAGHNAGGGGGGRGGDTRTDDDRPREFGELSLLGMMDVLTGELVKWQKAFT